MTLELNAFPLAGSTVCAALHAVARPEQLWTLTDIETLADPPAEALGDLWQRVRRASVIVSTLELCGALEHATQVISLDLTLIANPQIRLVVEDGLAVEWLSGT
ncbi:MAG: hypothetical protein Q8Q80_00235 [Methyloversatilis sp.]|uniref:hypothetical protein n=1 Tax=Methyloversatilis sp. TaxID=2569862 RepID=UPI0027324DB9|nr:hypothetical protein [Methyloversatilis sp.]MDP3871066.1 hypothetical protein [Methyloversatilis sp.]